MLRDTKQTIHPEDAEFFRRRQVLSRSLVAATTVGLVTEFGAFAHMKYQISQANTKVAEIQKTHPKPSTEAIAEATKTIEEQNTHHDLPDRKVIWAQEQLKLKKKFDEEFAREFPNGTIPWEKTDTAVGIGGGALGIASISVWRIVRGRTDRELRRRDFLRSIAGRSSEM